VRRTVVIASLLAAAAAPSASGGFTPAWSYVPPSVRARLAAESGGVLYLPARAPDFYRYRSGARVSGRVLSVTFTNRVRVRQGLWHWTKQTFQWRAQPLAVRAICRSWRANDKTLQLSGNKLYSGATPAGGSIAWRCVTDRRGRRFVLSAITPSAGAGVGMGLVVASGLDVSRRASGTTVALTVTPRTVRRGGTVLVRGVAGGCTSGDQVTIISQAFPAANSFAGVPAIFAEVGSAGRFSAKTTVPRTRLRGRYVVSARCGGGNLGVTADVRVR